MKIKQLGIVLTMLFATHVLVAQSSVQDFVDEGIQYHDSGDYEKAIETYKKALEINPKSPLANYEISLSYFEKGDYEQALKYSDMVLEQNAEFMVSAYVIKGSALDELGRGKESIKLFEKAIKKENGHHYLLYYNLALNHYRLGDLDNAEVNAIKAIEIKPNHASSHLMLANIHNKKGHAVQTLLATHFFLFLEPSSERSLEVYQMLMANFGGHVTKDAKKPNTINITLAANKDDDFGAAELMISLLEASKTLEENEGKTEDEMFIKNTDSFFTVLGELKKDKNKGIWWAFYTPFFYELAKSDHMEAYCKYISQIGNEESRKWMDINGSKLTDFDDWLNKK